MSFQKFDIVKVTKNTRANHAFKKATAGEMYMIVSMYTSPNYGTKKLFLVNDKGEDYYTTEVCAEKHLPFTAYKKVSPQGVWINAKKIWMERNYIPVIFTHFYNSRGMPIVSSRDDSAVFVTPLKQYKKNSNEGVWLNKNMVHDDDVKMLMSSSLAPKEEMRGEPSSAVCVRIPVWFAKKNRIF
jgi:hypothetical protein